MEKALLLKAAMAAVWQLARNIVDPAQSARGVDEPPARRLSRNDWRVNRGAYGTMSSSYQMWLVCWLVSVCLVQVLLFLGESGLKFWWNVQ